jgi:hypothetical protein
VDEGVQALRITGVNQYLKEQQIEKLTKKLKSFNDKRNN